MKLKFGLLFFLIIGSQIISAQKAYIVNDFLKGYTLYFVRQTNNTEINEYYRLTENQNKKKVLEFGEKKLAAISKNAKTIPFKNLPDKNICILGDVNFDGRKDIVIDGTTAEDEGCYWPRATSSIFINKAANFEFSQSISNVYNGAYCLRGGSFDIDTKYKRIRTSSLGGAANHGSEYYSVVDNKAKLVSTFEEDGLYPSPFSKITGKKLKNNKWVSFTSLSLYEEGLEKNKLLAFDTKNGKGRIILFKSDDILYYAFQQNDEYHFISFAYPAIPDKADKSLFKFTKQNAVSQLEFNSGSITYVIYETTSEVGIKIYVNGKLSDWQGTGKTGTLSALTNSNFKNMIKE